MKQFRVLDSSLNATRNAKVKFTGSPDCARAYILDKWNENYLDSLIDRLFDMQESICEDENGDLYSVIFEPFTHIPLVWCKVEPDDQHG